MDLVRRLPLALGFAAAGVLAALAVAPLMHSGAMQPTALAADGLATSVFLGCLALAGAALSSVPLSRRLALGPSRISGRTLALLLLGCLGLSHAIDGVVDLLGVREASALGAIDAAIAGARGSELLLLVIGLGVGPGIGEELLFRGLLQRGIVARAGPALGVLLAAAAFALVHVDLAHAAAAFPLGIYLGLGAFLAGSVRASVLCHIANNVVAVIGTAFGVAGDASAAGGAWNVTLPVGVAVAALALGVAWRESRHVGASGPGEARTLSWSHD